MAPFLTPWRCAAGVALAGLVAVPLLLPLLELAQHGIGTWSASDSRRVSQLLLQTLSLVGGTLALTLPVGIALALALFRTEFPGRRFLLVATFVMLFVPLPMIASAWQAFLGSDGWLPLTWWGPNAARPWTTGIGPAIWVHFLAGLPWVIVFVGIGSTWVERELEEQALLIGPPWWVALRFTLPRCRGAIVFAAVWLALQVAGEITVAYMMQVSTFAQEVHIQFSQGTGALARSVAAALPLVIATWALLTWYLTRLERLPALAWPPAEPRQFDFGRWRWAVAALLLVALLLIFGVPLASLLWKLGKQGHPPHWVAGNAWSHFLSACRTHGADLAKNLVTVGGAAAAISFGALILCWLADESRWFARLLIAVMALAWSLPGTIIALGLKQVIAWLPEGVLADLFYYQPSPMPLVWAYIVRFLPFAVAVLWPVVRLVPREPREAARLEGQGPWREFWTIVWPLTRHAVFGCGLLTAGLCLGEVASARVETPGWESFAKLLFDRMHYGVDNNVAALSVMLLGMIVLLAAVGVLTARRTGK
ncbi:MAG: ABC transporter permease subunit [Gemmataceae bacterium]|nr:ABC transporter permease subunit [Gemmataceae bacterium]